MPTHSVYATSERASWEKLHEQISTLRTKQSLQDLLKNSDENILILNCFRQIVYVTPAFTKMLEIEDPAEVYGCRQGEAIQCINVEYGADGCGTSDQCRTCKMLKAIVASQAGKTMNTECYIPRRLGHEPFRAGLHTIPLKLDNERYVFITVTPTTKTESSNAIQFDPTQDQVAEDHLSSTQVIESIRKNLQQDDSAVGKEVQVRPSSPNVLFNANKETLYYMLSQLTHNALECIHWGTMVELSCKHLHKNRLVFKIHLPHRLSDGHRIKFLHLEAGTLPRGRQLPAGSAIPLAKTTLQAHIHFHCNQSGGTTCALELPINC